MLVKLELLDIPEKKLGQLRKKGFEAIEDLAGFYPRRYNDFRKVVRISELPDYEGQLVSIIGTFTRGGIRQGYNYVQVKVSDSSGDTLNVVWFNQPYIVKYLLPGKEHVFCGKVQYSEQYQTFSMPSPLFFSSNPEEFHRIAPVYSKIPGMAADYLENCIQTAVSLITESKDAYDYMEPEVLERLGIVDYKTFLKCVHSPRSDEELSAAERRKATDELFPFAMKMGQKKYDFARETDFIMRDISRSNDFWDTLPFEPTRAQKRAWNEILPQLRSGNRLDALVQGDVGCGKTVIAMAAALVAAESGYQAVLMCPTSVLAEQHYQKLSAEFAWLGVKVGYLANGLKTKEKKAILAGIASGEVQVVVGTHSVISADVRFNNLGLTIVDEEHRFGVEQRNLLREKARDGVHHISMSATPIPRTLATTIYGENTTIINIDEKPAGRKPVETILCDEAKKVYASMYKQIKEGRQCYVVCPLIEESDSDVMGNVESVEATYEEMKKHFSRYPEVHIEMVAGNMKQAEIKEKIDMFASGVCHILISTTIIEVGVNIPNATVMVIKNAERFGLSQLHQLRGRVGRSDMQSYCVLLSSKRDNARLEAMVETDDGFEIARKDLELRGTGNLVGTKQSGVDKYITLMLQNKALYDDICKEVDDIFMGKLRYEKYAALQPEE